MHFSDPKKQMLSDTVGVLIKDPGGKLKDEMRQAQREGRVLLLRKKMLTGERCSCSCPKAVL